MLWHEKQQQLAAMPLDYDLNDSNAALARRVSDTMRELQRLREQRLVLLELLAEAALVIHNLPDEVETQDEADTLNRLKDRIADARGAVLLELSQR